MLKIGDFSKLTRVSVRMLRYYDKIDLLKPYVVDDFTGYRYYSADQIHKVHRIQVLQKIGFTLSEIGGLIEKDLNTNLMRSLLSKRKQEIQQEIQSEQEKLLRVEALINFIDKEDFHMNYDIALKSIPAYKVLSLRDTLAAYHAEGQLWDELHSYVGKHNIKVSSPCYAIYHDEGYRESDVDIEVTMAIDEDVIETGRIKLRTLEPVSNMAVLFHEGPFEEVGSAYLALGEWLSANGYELNGPTRAIYHKGPWCEESPENYLTELHAPVIKKK